MARTIKKNFIQSASSRIHEIMQGIVSKGHNIRYAREALYPILEVKTLMRERSRDQLGDIESIVLKIVGEGVGLPDDIANLLGFRPNKLYPIIIELEGRSLISGKSTLSEKQYFGASQKQYSATTEKQYSVTELGKLSLEQGSAVFEVERSLLICGLTGRLLSYEMYDIPRISTNKISRAVFGRDFIDGASKIPLSGLSMSSIQDKRKVNLPDEIIEILGVIDTCPYFLEGVLVMYSDPTGKDFAELGIGRGIVDWLKPEQVVPIIEPLGYSFRLSEELVLDLIVSELGDMGATTSGRPSLDRFQSPCVKIANIHPSFYNYQYGNRPLSMYMGTSSHPPIPIGRFPFPPKKKADANNPVPKKQDVLFGRTMLLFADNEELKKHIDVLRTADAIVNSYSILPPAEKKLVRLKNYLVDQLNKVEISVETVRLSLEQIPDSKLIRLLGVTFADNQVQE